MINIITKIFFCKTLQILIKKNHTWQGWHNDAVEFFYTNYILNPVRNHIYWIFIQCNKIQLNN